jgi:hypothetical protein
VIISDICQYNSSSNKLSTARISASTAAFNSNCRAGRVIISLCKLTHLMYLISMSDMLGGSLERKCGGLVGASMNKNPQHSVSYQDSTLLLHATDVLFIAR